MGRVAVLGKAYQQVRFFEDIFYLLLRLQLI